MVPDVVPVAPKEVAEVRPISIFKEKGGLKTSNFEWQNVFFAKSEMRF